ncbi:ABC transporter permease [Leucobacter komagatae]|nr:ABC transporter permease [Leucobacter komagatae]
MSTPAMNPADAPSAAAPKGPGLRALWVLMGCEARMVMRDTSGLIIPLGMPLLILVTSAASTVGETVRDGFTAFDLFVLPIVFVTVVALIGVINMPSFLASYRKTGVLLRLGATPASPMFVLVAHALVSIAQAAIGIALAFGVALVFFGANPPANPGVALAILLLVTAAMYGVGMIIASLAPTQNSALAIGFVVFLAFAAMGGLFGGRQALPPALAPLADWLPVGAGTDALGAAWAGSAIPLAALLALAATVAISAAVAGLFFRWE